jgi:hypothetical protein
MVQTPVFFDDDSTWSCKWIPTSGINVDIEDESNSLLCLKLLFPSQRLSVSFCVYFTVHFLEMGFLKLWHRIFNVVTLATVMVAFHIGGCIQEVIIRQEANAIIGDQLFILAQKMGRCVQHAMHYECVAVATGYA